MIYSKLILVAAVSATFATSIAARADSARCQLLTYQPTQVAPLYDAGGAYGGTRRLAGAQVFVPAQPSLTPQWLRRDFEHHIANMKQHPMVGCPLSNAGISVTVVPGATGFWVQISTESSETAKVILQQSERLFQQPASR